MDFTAPTPALQPAFRMRIERGAALSVGTVATGGERLYLPVTGGAFEGEGLRGRLAGGGETLLARADGVTMVEASYLIAFPGGMVARAFGSGYRTGGADFRGLRLPLYFEVAQDGALAALATSAFIAAQGEDDDVMTIHRII